MTKRHDLLTTNVVTRLTAMIVLCAMAASPAAASLITWDAPVAVSTVGDAIVRNDGTLVKAINFSPGSPLTRNVNGVAFTAQTAVEPGWNSITGAAGIYADGVVSADFENMLDGFMFGSPGTTASPISSETLTLSDLTSGNEYLVQLFVSDDRANVGTRTQNFDGGGSISATVANNLSYSLIGTFIADAATQDIAVIGLPGGLTTGNPILNAYQVRQIPEPSSLLIVGMAFLVMMLTKRLWMKKARS